MFDYIKIEGFRSFKKVELEMPRLAVLIGPNGGGKSNFIDLLMLMAEAGCGELAVAVNGPSIGISTWGRRRESVSPP
jgi:predicted ATPase